MRFGRRFRRLSTTVVIVVMIAGSWPPVSSVASVGDETLSGPITVGQSESSDTYGFGESSYGSLADTTFSRDGTDYNVEGLGVYDAGQNEVELRADQSVPLSTGSGLTANAVMIPAAPTNLTVVAGDRQVGLSWADPVDSSISKYQYSTDGGATFTDVPNSDATTVSYTVGGLTSGASYTLGVRAVNGAGEGGVSMVTTRVLPAAPSGLAVTGGDTQVTLSWDDPSDSSISGYRYSADDGATYTDIPDSDATTVSYTVAGLTNYTSYDFGVRAVNSSGPGPVSDTATATPGLLPPAPTNLSVTPGDTQAALSWDDPNNSAITKYRYSTDGGATFTDIPNSDATTVSYTVGGLNSGAEYTLGVRAVNTAGDGAASTVTARVLPAQPTGLTATGGDTQVTLSWNDPGDSSISGYRYSTDGGATFGDIPGSDATTVSYTVSGLTNYTSYDFGVRAVNSSGPGPVSDTAVATPGLLPAAPTNLSATPGDTQAALSWDDPNNSTITKYQYSTDGATTFTDIDPSNATTVSYMVTGLTNYTAYDFGVRAVNSSGPGPVSDTATATPAPPPAAPTNLSVTPGDRQVALSWDDPADSSITKYQYSTDAGATFTNVPNSGATTVSYTVTGLASGAEYTLGVRAVNITGEGGVSMVTTRVLPAAPSGFAATGGDAQVTLSWTDPGDSSISGYRYSADGGATFGDIPGSDATTVSYAVSGLTNYTSYDFGVRAVNASGPGPVSDTATATPAPPPAAPTNLSVTPGDRQVALSWTNPNNSTITKYQYSTDGGTTFGDIPGSDAATVSYTVGGLNSGDEYTLGVRAVNTTGDGGVSMVTTRVLPAQPTGLTATGGDTQVTLSWTDPGDSSISGYRYSADGGATFGDIPGSDSTTVLYTVSGLTNYTSYDFGVRAVNASGPGPVSDSHRRHTGAAAARAHQPVRHARRPSGGSFLGRPDQLHHHQIPVQHRRRRHFHRHSQQQQRDRFVHGGWVDQRRRVHVGSTGGEHHRRRRRVNGHDTGATRSTDRPHRHHRRHPSDAFLGRPRRFVDQWVPVQRRRRRYLHRCPRQ